MENKPKSRAFIVTFIIVFALLLVGYLLLRNSGSPETKGQSTLGKIFAPLLGTSKEKDIKTIDPNDPSKNSPINTDPSTNINEPGGDGPNPTDPNLPGNIPVGGFDPNNNDNDDSSFNNLNSLPSPKLSSTIKPIKSGGLASQRPGGLIGSNPNTSSSIKESLCPVDDPLSNYFTDQEKKDLDNYLRQFYLIAPSIRTADDILITENEILENTSFGGKGGQLEQLIKDCYDQKSDPRYTGPQIVKDNPYYQGNSPYERDSYLPNYKPASTSHGRTIFMGRTYESTDPTKQSFNLFEKLLYIW